MSRTDPYKKKPRSANRTLLFYGEGLNEEVFLKHLRSLFAYGKNVAVTVRRGKGGSARDIVVDAANDFSAFDKRVVILDNDKEEAGMIIAREQASTRNIELLENTPCLECLFLSILEPRTNHGSRSSNDCKKYFQEKYLNGNNVITDIECKKLFSRPVLEGVMTTNLQLKRIIEILEGGF